MCASYIRPDDDVLQQRGDPGAQYREFALDDVPDEREINAEIFVDQLVAHSRDLAPRDRVIVCPGFRRQALDRLTEDLDVADDRVLGLPIGEEGVAAVLGVPMTASIASRVWRR